MIRLIRFLDITGKVWNAPNSLFGLLYGTSAYLYGKSAVTYGFCSDHPCVSIGNNAIEFTNIPHPFMLSHGAVTLGNVIIYGPNAYSHARHETVHTYQGQFLGPAYIPLNLICMAASALSYPIASLRRRGIFHGRVNFMEGNPARPYLYGQFDTGSPNQCRDRSTPH